MSPEISCSRRPLELLFDALQLVLSQLSPLNGPLQLVLLHTELPAQLVQLLLVVRTHLGGCPQVLVQLLQGDLVVHAGALDGLAFFRMLSASLEVVASLVTVPARFSSDFLASSSISMILRERAGTSPSTSLYIFSFSSRDSEAFCSLSQVSSNSISRP